MPRQHDVDEVVATVQPRAGDRAAHRAIGIQAHRLRRLDGGADVLAVIDDLVRAGHVARWSPPPPRRGARLKRRVPERRHHRPTRGIEEHLVHAHFVLLAATRESACGRSGNTCRGPRRNSSSCGPATRSRQSCRVSPVAFANWKLPISFWPCGAIGTSSNSTSGLPTTVDMSVPAPSK